MVLLSARELEFLEESNAIENIHNVDYSIPANAVAGAGHVGAYLDSQELAKAKAPLSAADLCRWQKWITEEQLRFGHPIPPEGVGILRGPQCPRNVRVGDHIAPEHARVPGLINTLLDDVNASLRMPACEDADLAALLGDAFQRFEAIHPFVDGNGRTGRLFANYIATRFDRPILVIRVHERKEYYAAHKSKLAMRRFMAGKLRDAVMFAGKLFLRVKTFGATDELVSADGEKLLLECHDLLAAMEEWE